MWTRRQLMDGITVADQGRCPLARLPERYGPCDRVYDPFRRWQRMALGPGSSPSSKPRPTRRA
ncbi:hypothetical protein [Streptomyces formicae]|uniref:hypothetical protein n=1 Tax=Streptomyces formicae TaxID=1616117 RepID=UPI001F59A6D3|nr:hypothetical protein [Streptomyces formicae]